MISTIPNLHSNQLCQLRERLFYLMLASLMAVVVASVAALLLYMMPASQEIYIGKLAQFPPSDAPYRLNLPNDSIYLVNIDGTVTALLDRGTHWPFCPLLWQKPSSLYAGAEVNTQARFMDPCVGGDFALNGGYLWGPAPRHMDRYKVRIDGYSNIYIDPQVRLIDSQPEFLSRCFEAQRLTYGELTPDMEAFCLPYNEQHPLNNRGE